MSEASGSQTEKPLSMMDYDELAQKKREAIEEMDFESARDIETMIRTKKRDDVQAKVENKKVELGEGIEALHQEYLEDCRRVQEAAEERQFNIRVKVDQSFQEWQKQHLDELMSVEKEYALEVIRARSRPVKEQLMLFRQAKNLAKMNCFDESIMVREEGKQAYVDEMEARRQEIEDKYRNARFQVIEHQKNDLEILKGRLEAFLKQARLDLQDELDSQQRKFLVAVRSLQQKAVVAATSWVKSSAEKRAISDIVNDFVIAKVQELSGVTLSYIVIPLTSPRSDKTLRSPTKSRSQTRSGPVTPKRSGNDDSLVNGSPASEKERSVIEEEEKVEVSKSVEEEEKVEQVSEEGNIDEILAATEEETRAEAPRATEEEAAAEAPQAKEEETVAEAPRATEEETVAEAPQAKEEETVAEAPQAKEEETVAEAPQATEEEAAAEVPPPAEEETPAEVQPPAEEETAVEAPHATEEETAAEAPQAKEEETVAEAPHATEEETAAEAPQATEEEAAAEAPRATEEEAAAEAPHATEEEAAAEAPRPTEEEAVAEAPHATEEEAAAEAPRATEEEAVAEAPHEAEGSNLDE